MRVRRDGGVIVMGRQGSNGGIISRGGVQLPESLQRIDDSEHCYRAAVVSAVVSAVDAAPAAPFEASSVCSALEIHDHEG